VFGGFCVGVARTRFFTVMNEERTMKNRLEIFYTVFGLAICLIALGFGAYVLALMYITSR